MVRAALLFDLVRLGASQGLWSCSDPPFHNFSATSTNRYNLSPHKGGLATPGEEEIWRGIPPT